MSRADSRREGHRASVIGSPDAQPTGNEHLAAVAVKLEHCTRYAYDRAVWLSAHEVRLRPAAHTRIPIESYKLGISPTDHDLRWYQDLYGNWVARALFPSATRELRIEVGLLATLIEVNPFNFYLAESARSFPFSYSDEERLALTACLQPEPAGPLLAAWLDAMRQRLCGVSMGTIEYLVDINRSIAADIRYLTRMEPGVQTCEQTLIEASGSCRDSAWLLAQILRHSGLAARFVSGYLVQLHDSTRVEQPLQSAAHDSLALHAWCEAYIPGAGWIGLDPTSGLLAAGGHIPLACAAIPASAAAVSGYAGRAHARMSVEMRATRILPVASATGGE